MTCEKRLKIAFLANSDRNIFLFRLALAKALIKEGHSLYAIVPGSKYCGILKDNGIKVIQYEIFRGSLNPFREIKTFLQLFRIFKDNNFDLLHSFTIKSNVYGSLLGRLFGVRRIVTHITGLGYLFIDNRIIIRLLRSFVVLLLRFSFALSDIIVFQNPQDCAEFGYKPGAKKVIMLKGSGVDLGYFSPENDAGKIKIIRSRFNIDESGVVVSFIGRIIEHKGIRELIEVAKKITGRDKNAVFLIAGEIDVFNRAAAGLDLSGQLNDNIIYLGWQEQEGVKDILSVTDIFVIPSYREGVPKAALEAMAMAKPIIATDVPGCREVARDGINGFLVPPRDALALEDRIERLIADSRLRGVMGKESMKIAQKEFDELLINAKIISLYGYL